VNTARDDGKTEGKEEGIEIGKVEGIEIGKLKEKREMALNCLKENIAIETIMKLTGLTKEDIEKLI